MTVDPYLTRGNEWYVRPMIASTVPVLCSTCGFSLQRPDDWSGEYWTTIRDNRGVHHYWCHGRGDLLEGIERTAQAAWEAGL